jgi:hypothetical protein
VTGGLDGEASKLMRETGNIRKDSRCVAGQLDSNISTDSHAKHIPRTGGVLHILQHRAKGLFHVLARQRAFYWVPQGVTRPQIEPPVSTQNTATYVDPVRAPQKRRQESSTSGVCGVPRAWKCLKDRFLHCPSG